MNPWTIIAMTYEQSASGWRPVVRHEFYGQDDQEALGVLYAHMSTDQFLSGCTRYGRWGQIVCRTELSLRDPSGTETPLVLR